MAEEPSASSRGAASAGNCAPEDGLRERKRAALRAAIERAAIALALEHGYENVTVDMICEVSMVSPRTFFNYFGSKEGVVFGPEASLPGEEQIEAFVHRTGSSVLGDFVSMLATSLASKELDPGMLRDRRTVIMRTPELLTKEAARMGEYEELFLRVIMDRFRSEGRTAAPGELDLEDEARMVIALTGGVMHYAMRKWFDEGTLEGVREHLNDSIALIRRITDGGRSDVQGRADIPEDPDIRKK